MGYYIELWHHPHDKAAYLKEKFKAESIPEPSDFAPPKDKVLVCVVNHYSEYDAALLVLDKYELDRVHADDSGRHREWLLMTPEMVAAARRERA